MSDRTRAALKYTGVALLVAIVLLLTVDGGNRLARGIRTGSADWSDYMADRLSAKAWRDGNNPYRLSRDLAAAYEPGAFVLHEDTLRNPHTPFYVILLSPLSFLSYRTARVVLIFLSGAALIAAVATALQAQGKRWWLAFGVLAIPAVHYELLYGQLMGLMLLVFVLAWRQSQARHDVNAGVLLGLATALKLFPILLLPFILTTRRWRLAGWFVASTLLWSGAAIAILGAQTTRSWLDASTSNLDFWGPSVGNLSFAGYLARLSGRWNLVFGLIGAAAAILLIQSARDLWDAMPWLVLGSPLAWLHYGVLIIPSITESKSLALVGLLALVTPVLSAPLALVGPLFTVCLIVIGWRRRMLVTQGSATIA